MIEVRDRENAAPSSDPPEREYERTYRLLPQGATLDEAVEAMRAGYESRQTVGFSADDAGLDAPQLTRRCVIATAPEDWPDDLEAFFKEYYPGVELEYAEESQPAELTLAYPSTHLPAAITSKFGEDRGSYIHMGLDLRSSWHTWGDEVLAALDGKVIFAGVHPREAGYGWQIKTAVTLADERKVRVRYAHFAADSLYVEEGDAVEAGDKLGKPDNTGNSSGDHLHIDVQIDGEYVDPESLIEFPDSEPPEPDFPMRGVHDRGGGEWMASQQLRGWCTIPIYVKEYVESNSQRRQELLSGLRQGIEEMSDVRVILNLRWHYADPGAGTMPAPGRASEFESGCLAYMEYIGEAAWGYCIANEMNNPREWPAGSNGNKYNLTPDDFISTYNYIYSCSPPVRLAPGAIDAYNAGWGDWRPHWHRMWESILGADFVTLHAYDHGQNADRGRVFENTPLQGVGFNLNAIAAQVGVLSERYRRLPRIVTETNHGASLNAAWGDDSGAWVEDAYEYLGGHSVVGACLFRFNSDDDQWRFGDHQSVLDALKGIG